MRVVASQALRFAVGFAVGAGGRARGDTDGQQEGPPPVCGVERTTVLQDEGDPWNLHRVKVHYIDLPQSPTGSDWARVAFPAAAHVPSPVQLPAIHREVLVAFEHCDIDKPYVLGVLTNGRDRDPP
jgi:uncharacterized protein involved in type VI secretion and phage assembly